MKRLGLSLLVTLVLSLVVAACGSDTPAAAPAPVTVEKVVTVVVPGETVVQEVVRTVVVVREVVATPAPVSPSLALEAKKYGGDLRVVAQGSIKSLDANFTGAYVSGAVSLNYQEGLFALDENFDPKPQLVGSWDLSKDALTYTLTLREGPTFHHDGGHITSDDAIASLERWEGASSGRTMFAFLADPGLVKVDDRTFTMSFKQPYSPNITHLALLRGRGPMWPQEIAVTPSTEDVGEDNYSGTGPYKLQKWEVGNRVILERYEDYVPRSDPHNNYAGAQIPYVDRIIWLEIPSEETKAAGLKTGEWDIVDGMGLDFYDDMKANPDIDVALGLPGQQSRIYINATKAPSNNIKIRQAMNVAINAAAYMAAIGPKELYTVCATMFQCGTPLESHAGDPWFNQNNPELAKQLLAESGYAGEPWVHMNPTDYGTITPLGAVFKQQMEDIGVNIVMPAMDWSTLIGHLRDLDYYNSFSAFSGFYGVKDPVNDGWIAAAGATGGRYVLENPLKVAELRDRYIASLDPKEKSQIIDELEAMYFEEVNQIHLGQFFPIYPFRTWVKNFNEVKGMPNFNNVWLER